MTSYGYIIMIIVDSCIILFHFDCIMQLKKSYYIATNVCSRKSSTTFGDLPDWWKGIIVINRDCRDAVIAAINPFVPHN